MEALGRCSTWIGSNLSHKHWTRLENLNWEKCSSLFDHCLCDEENSCVTFVTGPNVIKLLLRVIYRLS
jgi:hypothetical protein